jgi:hypothetical protein
MLRSFRPALLCALLAGASCASHAFTLLGPNPAWQTALLSYDINAPMPGFGPMNLGEEYRWNTPTIYYAFTSDFLNYFGDRGAREIDKAVQVLNDLPPINQLNINNYPLTSLRINHRAQALGLTDVRSFILQVLLFELGVGDPTRFVYSIRNRWIPGGCPPILYHVIKRNFDPETLSHSSYINGDLWTYTFISDGCDVNKALLLPEPVDPMALLGFRSMPVSSQQGMFIYGGFWTALTRDDVAALRYIYRPDNYNVENYPPGAIGGTNFFGTGSSPWGAPPGYFTNATSTNSFIDPGLRGGINKLAWTRLEYDSVLGGFFTPVTNIYSESVIVNSRSVEQGVQRVLLVPDIIFDGGDLQGGDTTATIFIATYGGSPWDNNDAINGIAGQDGPGTVVPSSGNAPALVLTLNTVGPIWGNQWPLFLSEDGANQPNTYLLWGSFDGSTNAPFVYPGNISIEAIEAQVLGQ